MVRPGQVWTVELLPYGLAERVLLGQVEARTVARAVARAIAQHAPNDPAGARRLVVTRPPSAIGEPRA